MWEAPRGLLYQRNLNEASDRLCVMMDEDMERQRRKSAKQTILQRTAPYEMPEDSQWDQKPVRNKVLAGVPPPRVEVQPETKSLWQSHEGKQYQRMVGELSDAVLRHLGE